MAITTTEAKTAKAEVKCPQCEAVFKSSQGLAGHRRFRHGNTEWSEAVDRSRAQKLEALNSFSSLPGLPQPTQLLIAKLHRKLASANKVSPPTDCVLCGAVCKTAQGLSGHMRYRHGYGVQRSDPRAAIELVRYAQTNDLPELVREAIWEKILRLEGFRW